MITPPEAIEPIGVITKIVGLAGEQGELIEILQRG